MKLTLVVTIAALAIGPISGFAQEQFAPCETSAKEEMLWGAFYSGSYRQAVPILREYRDCHLRKAAWFDPETFLTEAFGDDIPKNDMFIDSLREELAEAHELENEAAAFAAYQLGLIAGLYGWKTDHIGYLTEAVELDPDNPTYQLALEKQLTLKDLLDAYTSKLKTSIKRKREF
jgi:hypothetical protein